MTSPWDLNFIQFITWIFSMCAMHLSNTSPFLPALMDYRVRLLNGSNCFFWLVHSCTLFELQTHKGQFGSWPLGSPRPHFGNNCSTLLISCNINRIGNLSHIWCGFPSLTIFQWIMLQVFASFNMVWTRLTVRAHIFIAADPGLNLTQSTLCTLCVQFFCVALTWGYNGCWMY